MFEIDMDMWQFVFLLMLSMKQQIHRHERWLWYALYSGINSLYLKKILSVFWFTNLDIFTLRIIKTGTAVWCHLVRSFPMKLTWCTKVKKSYPHAHIIVQELLNWQQWNKKLVHSNNYCKHINFISKTGCAGIHLVMFINYKNIKIEKTFIHTRAKIVQLLKGQANIRSPCIFLLDKFYKFMYLYIYLHISLFIKIIKILIRLIIRLSHTDKPHPVKYQINHISCILMNFMYYVNCIEFAIA